MPDPVESMGDAAAVAVCAECARAVGVSPSIAAAAAVLLIAATRAAPAILQAFTVWRAQRADPPPEPKA